MSESFNNLLVRSLRKGSAEAVDSLLSMGQGPSVILDWVEPNQQSLTSAQAIPRVASRSIWFWVHQAPVPAASQRCWEGWFLRELGMLPTPKMDQRLKFLFGEAVDASLSSGEFSPLLETWPQMLELSEAVEGSWNNPRALRVLASKICSYPTAAPRLLELLELEGLASRSDVLAWAKDASGPWDLSVSRAHPGLLQSLCDMCSPVPKHLLVRLEERGLNSLADCMGAGVGVWNNEDAGRRAVDCLEVIKGQGLAPDAARFSPRVRSVFEKAMSDSSWDASDIAPFRAWFLSVSLPSFPEKVAAKVRF